MENQYPNGEVANIANEIAQRSCALLKHWSITPRVICKHNKPTHYTKEGDDPGRVAKIGLS